MNDRRTKHHELFYKFKPWERMVPANWDVNFLGVMTRTDYFSLFKSQPEDRYEISAYPLFNEEYFEWIDLLEAITTAKEHFTMIELGAGWGRWIANATAALKQSNGLPCTLIAVEAEPTHFKWMVQHLQDNNVDLKMCQLVQAAVTDKDGKVGFHTGKTPWGGPTDCYGQCLGGPTEVDAISLRTLLMPLEKVDLIDLDVQGAELEVLKAAADELNQKVKRVHIETHNRAVETGLRVLFSRLGWEKLYDYPCSLEYPKPLEGKTDWGVIPFQGGVQTWANPRLIPSEDMVEFTAKLAQTTMGLGLWINKDDHSGKLLLAKGIYEVPETDVVSRLLRPGDTCIDAGCHLGYYTCLMAHLVGPEGRVYAFDANPSSCRRTLRNLALNRLQSAEVMHAALGTDRGTTSFYVSTDDQSGLSSLGPIKPHKEILSVPWLRLEDFLRERSIEHIRLLKLDVEGAEELVLEGLGPFLRDHLVDYILVECYDERLKLVDSSTERVASLMQQAGYVCWEYGTAMPSGWSKTAQVRSRDDCNYLFSRLQDSEAIPTVSLAEPLVQAHNQVEQLQDEHTQLRAQVAQLQNEVMSLKRRTETEQQLILPPAAKTLVPTPAHALWNQRDRLASLADRIKALSAAVNHPTDLTRYQWVQIMAFALEFRPDLVIELGRGMGNSTCCFLEVANQLGGAEACRVVSLCLSSSWFDTTVPRLRKVVPQKWFAPGHIKQGNILEYDFTAEVERAQRCLVFWDAHGFEIAECVLGNLLPSLADKPHLVLMHDMSDIRYEIPSREYGELGIWKGENAAEPALWLGHIFSRVAQSVAIVDFCTRNHLPLHSAVESLHMELAQDPEKLAALRLLLGDEMFSLQSHWFWFTLNEATKKVTFPRFRRGPGVALEQRPLSNTEIEKHHEDIDWLMEALRAQEEEVARLRGEKREWETTWAAVQATPGWQLLNWWRRLRDALAPGGTRRRKIYETALRPFRSPSSRSV